MNKPCFGSGMGSSITCYTCVDEGACNQEVMKLKGSQTSQINPRLFDERISKDQYYVDIALAVSKRSTCLKRHYGAVIVKDDRIVATGYNGSPRGDVNCCDTGCCQRVNAVRYSNYEKCPAVHAEQNAMLSASHEQMLGATLYLACEVWEDEVPEFYNWHEDHFPEPCSMCLKMIRNSGIARVVCRGGDIKWA